MQMMKLHEKGLRMALCTALLCLLPWTALAAEDDVPLVLLPPLVLETPLAVETAATPELPAGHEALPAPETVPAPTPVPTAAPVPATMPAPQAVPAPPETREPETAVMQTEAPQQLVTVLFVLPMENGQASVYHSYTASVGSQVRFPDRTPARSGWVFVHWYDEAQGMAVPFVQGTVTGNMRLAAHFTRQQAGMERMADVLPTGQVHIMLASGAVRIGEMVTLRAQVEGVEAQAMGYQWQVQGIDGSWRDIPGANGVDYTFLADEAGIRAAYRVCVAPLGEFGSH